MSKIRYAMALPFFPEKDIEPILTKFRAILRGEGLLSMGENVKLFESKFAKHAGSAHAVATNSCSAALEIALRAIGLKAGDEVVVPAETFIATGAAVVMEGGRPVFAEMNPETFCLSAADLKMRITGRTKAVIIVHMAGLVTPEIYEIMDFCRRRDIVLIEDAAHAPGASLDGRHAGTFGQIGCFSFYPTKVITTGEGGMLLTNDTDIYARANSYRNRGLDLTSCKEAYAHLGTNNRMTEFAAILGLSQLRRMDDFVAKRNGIANVYSRALQNFDKLAKPLSRPPNAIHSYWRYLVRLNERIDREMVRTKMAEEGIVIDWAYDPPLHLQSLFKKLYGHKDGDLPVTEKAMKHFVCLPIHAGLSEEDAGVIVNAFKNILELCLVR